MEVVLVVSSDAAGALGITTPVTKIGLTQFTGSRSKKAAGPVRRSEFPFL